MRAKPNSSQHKDKEQEDASNMEAELRRRARLRKFSMWNILGGVVPDPIDYHAVIYEDGVNTAHKVFARNSEGFTILFDTSKIAEGYRLSMTAGDPETRLVVEVGAAVWRHDTDRDCDIPFLAGTAYDPTFEPCVIVDDKKRSRVPNACLPRDAACVWYGHAPIPDIIEMHTVLVRGQPMCESTRDQMVVFRDRHLAESAQAIAGKGVVHPIRVARHTHGFEGRPIGERFATVSPFGKTYDYQEVVVVDDPTGLSGLDLIEP